MTDLLDRKLPIYVTFQIIVNPAERFVVTFELACFDWTVKNRGNRSRISSDYMDKKMLQIIKYHLLRRQEILSEAYS